MKLGELVAQHRVGGKLPRPMTMMQRVCLLFVGAAAECEGGRPLSRADVRLVTGGRFPDNSLNEAFKALLKRGCIRHLAKRGQFLLAPEADWPEDGRGQADGSVAALATANTRKRNPTASRPYSVNTLKGLV